MENCGVDSLAEFVMAFSLVGLQNVRTSGNTTEFESSVGDGDGLDVFLGSNHSKLLIRETWNAGSRYPSRQIDKCASTPYWYISRFYGAFTCDLVRGPVRKPHPYLRLTSTIISEPALNDRKRPGCMYSSQNN
jgi:hypothetical protein